jgi:hypothetical protein
MKRAAPLALVLLSALCAALVGATHWLIVPWRAAVPWYESAATFPRAMLACVSFAALLEAARRLRGGAVVTSEELDSGAARLPRAALVLALFVAYALAVPVLGFGFSTIVFVALAARAAGLSWRAGFMLALPLGLALWAVFVPGLKVAFGHGWLF